MMMWKIWRGRENGIKLCSFSFSHTKVVVQNTEDRMVLLLSEIDLHSWKCVALWVAKEKRRRGSLGDSNRVSTFIMSPTTWTVYLIESMGGGSKSDSLVIGYSMGPPKKTNNLDLMCLLKPSPLSHSPAQLITCLCILHWRSDVFMSSRTVYSSTLH